MRLAVYHDLPSGGAKRVLYEVLLRLRSLHAVDVYTLSTADHAFCDVRSLVGPHKIFPFQSSRLFDSPFGRLNQLQRLRDLRRLDTVSHEVAREIDAGGYDAVWVHPCMWVQAPHVLRHLRTPSSFFVHESMRWAYEPEIERSYRDGAGRRMVNRFDPLNRLYRRAVIKTDRENFLAATDLITNSCFTASNVTRIYGRHAQVCLPGVDAERFSPARGRSRENWLLSVGEIRPEKGFDFLIEAVARIPSDRRPPLRVIGNASNDKEVAYLRGLARTLDVVLQIETNVDIDTLVERYNEAALVVYAPVREPLGLVALEAMACEAAVVGVNEGGVRETVVDSVTGRLVERNLEQFAATVQELLDDADLRESYGREGRKRVLDCWSWDRAAQQVGTSLVHLTRYSKAA
jgi:glycosyltransferase involved in cell wall biosynthesis